MRLKGISNKGFSRIAQSREDQTSFPGMEDARHPSKGEIEVLGVEKFVSSGSGYNENGTYDEAMGWSIEQWMSAGEEVSPDQAMRAMESGDVDDADELDDVDQAKAYLGSNHASLDALAEQFFKGQEGGVWVEEDGDVYIESIDGIDDNDEYASDDEILSFVEWLQTQPGAPPIGGSGEAATYDSLTDAAREKGLHGDTTYNFGWWGNDITYLVLAGEIGAGEIIIAANLGTFVGAEGVIKKMEGEELPWYDLSLNVTIKTNQGDILLDSTDSEAYYFNVYQDETDILGEGTDISYSDLEEKLPGIDKFFWM